VTGGLIAMLPLPDRTPNYFRTGLSIMPGLLRALEPPGTGDPQSRILLLADSTGMSTRPGQNLAQRLRVFLRRREATARLVPLVYEGFDPFDYYCLADKLAGARPQLVVLGINLHAFERRRSRGTLRPEMVGWIAPRRLPETVRLPLVSWGITADMILLRVGLVQTGALRPWSSLRDTHARVGRGLERLRDRVALGPEPGPATRLREDIDTYKLDRWTTAGRRAFSREGALETYGTALRGIRSDHPVLQLLAATLRQLEAAGAQTLVYVVPVKQTPLERTGLGFAGLELTLERVGSVVRSEGAAFVDAHALLPDDAFNDPTHFDTRRSMTRLAAALIGPMLAEVGPGEGER
jgi:hypothetical protein